MNLNELCSTESKNSKKQYVKYLSRNTLTINSIQSIRDEDSMWTETENPIVRRIDN